MAAVAVAWVSTVVVLGLIDAYVVPVPVWLGALLSLAAALLAGARFSGPHEGSTG